MKLCIYLRKIIKSYYIFITRTPAWALILFFSLSVALCGILTTPRFNDGLIHLSVAKEWFSLGHRPVTIQYAETLKGMGECPLWYWSVQGICQITGKFHYIAAQIFQAFCYACMLITVYFFARRHCRNIFKAKTALIVCATLPMITVTTVLCFLDVLCAFFVTLSFYLLYKKKFLLAAISAAGIWYSKRSGFTVLPAFFIAWGIAILLENKRKLLNIFKEAIIGILAFTTLVSWDIWFRIKNLNIANDFLLTYEKDMNIQHSPSASPLKLFDWMQWTGGTIPFLFVFFLAVLIGRKTDIKKFLRDSWQQIILFVIFSIFFLSFSPAYTIRYYAIISPAIIVVLLSSLPVKRLQALWLVLVTGALLQFALITFYIYHNRQVSSEAKAVLSYLEKQPAKAKIIWYEKEFGYYSLGRNIYWQKYFRDLLKNNIDKLLKGNVKNIVVTKRFSYKYDGKFYDRGLPYFAIKKLSQDKRFNKVIDNKMYSVYTLSGK